jgi:hypothetical protein
MGDADADADADTVIHACRRWLLMILPQSGTEVDPLGLCAVLCSACYAV